MPLTLNLMSLHLLMMTLRWFKTVDRPSVEELRLINTRQRHAEMVLVTSSLQWTQTYQRDHSHL
jgi:hypothetical protein